MLTCIFAMKIAPPLTSPYDGPYKVIVRSGRVMKILVKGKVETVSLDRVKPAYLIETKNYFNFGVAAAT